MLRFFFLLTVFLPLLLTAQTDSLMADTTTYVPFVAYWAKGDTLRYEVEKWDLQFEQDSLTKSDTTRYTAIFVVLDSTETSYLVNWHFEEYQNSAATQALLNETFREASEQLGSLEFEEIRFSTDEVGSFQQIENLEEIQAILEVYLEDLRKSALAATGNDPERHQKTKKALDLTFSMLRSRQYIESNMFVELIHLLHPMGSQFPAFDTLTYTENYPNNLGEGYVEGNGIYYFDTLDVANDYAHLKQIVELDEEDTREVLQEYFTRLGLDNEVAKELLETSSYDIVDDNDYFYYYYPGIPVFVDCMRSLNFEINGKKTSRVKRYFLTWID